MKLYFSAATLLMALMLLSCNSGGGGNFVISGKLISTSTSLTRGFPATGTVSHVMAVNPATSNPERVLGAVDSAGSFSLNVTGERPWILVFLDSSKTGKDMILGTFTTDVLHTLPPATASGTANLGNVGIASGNATAGISYEALLSALGLDASTAQTIGALDSVCLRYVNPDIDGNGSIDAEQSNAKFGLDFHIRYDMALNGSPAKVSDMVGAYLTPGVTTATYSSTGVYVYYLKTFSSATTGSFQFQNAVTLEGAIAVGANETSTNVTTNNFGDWNGFGPNLATASDLPSGEVRFTVGSSTLTFTNVQTPSLAQLTAPTGRIMPFLKINTSGAMITSIEYKWMKKTETSWTDATLAELSLLVNDDGGHISIRRANDANKTIEFVIPATATSGTLNWSASNATLSGVTAEEFASTTTSQLCHLGLSYDDKLGMRYFQNFDDDC